MIGFVNEFIIYNFALNTAQTIIVNNYLAAKYGLTLNANDIYTGDNNVSPGNFDYNVAGIGQASDGSNHTDSQGSGIVRISNPTALSNNEFLFWGEETRNPIYNFTTNTANYTEQLNSRWRVSRQGDPGTVTVSFDISGMDFTGKQPCSDLQLVVDDTYGFSSPINVYDLTIDDNTAKATDVVLPNNSFFTLRYIDQIVWDGSTFFNGANAGNNAPNNTNACLKFTVKADGAIRIDAHVREVEIASGATLNVANGVLLEVENKVLINENGTIDLLEEAQLIQNHTGTSTNSGTGILKIRQQGTTNGYSYNYWSSPVNRNGKWQVGYLEDATGSIKFTSALDPDPAISPITLSSRWLHTFNGPSNDYNAWNRITETTNLSPGTGYTMKGSGVASTDQKYIFKGTPNDGTYNVPVTIGTDFLTGNPYPSTLDANQFINDNLSLIDGTLYFWESFKNNKSHYLADYEGGYAVYNLLGVNLPAVADTSGLTSGLGVTEKLAPTQYINIGQGFFTTIVKSGTLTFNNNQRAFVRESSGETIFYKNNAKNKSVITKDNRSKIWFSFTSPKNYSKMIGLGYDANNASYGYDRGYDAKSNDNLKNDFYWILDDQALAIQALKEINSDDNLPLSFKVSDAGFYKFAINKMENIPNDVKLYLLDKNQNIYYDLMDEEATLLLDKGTFDAFSIVFKKEQSLATKSVEDKTMFLSYHSDGKTLQLHTKQPLTTMENFQIHNMLGQEIFHIKNPESYTLNVATLSNGIYFLKVNSKFEEASKNIKFVKY